MGVNYRQGVGQENVVALLEEKSQNVTTKMVGGD